MPAEVASSEESTTLRKCVLLENITCSGLTKWISAGGTMAIAPPATSNEEKRSNRTDA